MYTHLELSWGADDMDKHRAESGEKRLGTMEQLVLAHTLDPLPDLVLGITSDLFELLLLFRLGRGAADLLG